MNGFITAPLVVLGVFFAVVWLVVQYLKIHGQQADELHALSANLKEQAKVQLMAERVRFLFALAAITEGKAAGEVVLELSMEQAVHDELLRTGYYDAVVCPNYFFRWRWRLTHAGACTLEQWSEMDLRGNFIPETYDSVTQTSRPLWSS